LRLLSGGQAKRGKDLELAQEAYNQTDWPAYRREVVMIFYRVGFVGLKVSASSAYSWSHLGGVSVSSAELVDSTRIQIQATFWRVLGVYDGAKDESVQVLSS